MSSHDPSNGVPREPLEEGGHEKYAVVTEEAKTAAAKITKVCPDCQAVMIIDDKRNVSWCPNCGTRPFEPPTP